VEVANADEIEEVGLALGDGVRKGRRSMQISDASRRDIDLRRCRKAGCRETFQALTDIDPRQRHQLNLREVACFG
jgi:hypothetical protein